MFCIFFLIYSFKFAIGHVQVDNICLQYSVLLIIIIVHDGFISQCWCVDC